MPPARPKPIRFLGYQCYSIDRGHWQHGDDYVRVAIYFDDSWVGSQGEYKVYITLFNRNTTEAMHTLDWAGPKLEEIELSAREYLQTMRERLGWLLARRDSE